MIIIQKKNKQKNLLGYRNTLLTFIMKKLKKVSKKLDDVNSKIQECSKMEDYKLYGELLTSYLYKLDDIHKDTIVLGNYYNDNNPITIPLDISISPADNAKRYFKKYHKLKNAIDIVTVQKSELEKEINYLESIVYELQFASNIPALEHIYDEMENANLFSRRTNAKQGTKSFRIKKPKSKSKAINNFLSYSADGFTILVGRNNQENDYLTTKIAKENDIWFHVKDLQGSHVLLVVNHLVPSQELINKVASTTAYYSKAKQSSNVPVDYTLAKYVKKPAKSKPRHGNLYKSANSKCSTKIAFWIIL